MKRPRFFRPGLYLFLKYTVGFWFRIFYPVKITNPEIFGEMKPPFLLLPNHTMKWDAVILNLLFPLPLHCMASESHFRSPVTAWLMSALGIFPKAKAKNDLGAIRHMMMLKEQKRIICVFPEGQMNWDGGSMPLFWSTAKLIKLLKLPVYVPVYSGGSAVYPRWGKSRRKGPMELTIHPLFRDKSEFKSLSPEEIFEKMQALLNYRDLDETIREKGWHYESDERAEYLENILFICPVCRNIDSLRSRGNTLSCSSCGLEAELDAQYRFSYPKRPDEGAALPESPLEWNLWQRDVLPELWNAYAAEGEGPFMCDGSLTIKTGHRTDPLQNWCEQGDLALFKDHVMLKPEKGDMRLIPFDEISGVHVMTRQKLEFYHKETLYVFFFPDLRISGYKWLCLFRSLGIPSSYAWHGEEIEKI